MHFSIDYHTIFLTENNQLHQLAISVDRNIWIGISDKNHENRYNNYSCFEIFFSLFCSRFKLLSTGQAIRYSNWAENEPNNEFSGREDCVELFDESGKWNDVRCSVSKPFVCEIEL